MNRVIAGIAGVFMVLACSRSARADVRWDADAEGGMERRALHDRPAGRPDAELGPVFEAEGHVALVPLLRVGAYAHWDSSPVPGRATRNVFSAGLHARFLFPWLRGSFRAYLHSGVGEAATFADVDGSFTEVPVGLGGAYRVAPAVWVTLELGARLGFAFGGSYYRGAPAAAVGDDLLAGYLTTGVTFGR